MRLAPVAPLFFLLVGCGDRTADQRDIAALTSRVRAADGVKRLRENFNRGDCQAVYNEADFYFREFELPEEWLTACADMQAKLGKWRSFTADQQFPPGTSIGQAVFENGRFHIIVHWNTLNAPARLMRLYLQSDDGSEIQVPPKRNLPSRRGPHRPLMDPSPKRRQPVA